MGILKANRQQMNIKGLLCWVELRADRGGPLVLNAIYSYNPKVPTDGLPVSVPRSGSASFLLREGNAFGPAKKTKVLSAALMKSLRELAEKFPKRS